MKRISLLLAVAMAAFPAAAREISTDEAGRAAAAWARRDATPLGAALASADVAEVRTVENADGVPIFHVVRMAGGGVVVTSAESCVTPVVAFLDGDDADTNNPLWDILRADMALRTEQARAVRNGKRGLSVGVKEASSVAAESAWAKLLAKPTGTSGVLRAAAIPDDSGLSDLRVAPLVSTIWDQKGNVANYYTPTNEPGSPDNYPCGCVALVGAQIANFWGFPTESRAQVDRQCHVHGEPQTFRTMGGLYDWANMPIAFSTNANTVQRQAVGRLCYDFGVATQMEWGPDESSSVGLLLGDAFRDVFGYASAVAYARDSDGAMRASHIKRAVLANLDAGCPVALSLDAHTVVADGYGYSSQTLYTHLNLGWGGAGNVWYNLPEVQVDEEGIQYTNTVLDAVVYNIFPQGTGNLLTGRVLDVEGNPVANAAVTATSGSDTATGTTNARGIYALFVQEDGEWQVEATDGNLSGSRWAYVATSLPAVFEKELGGATITDGGRIGNSWGTDITLGVDMPQPTLADALDVTSLSFRVDGDAEWFVQPIETHDDEDAVQSGHVTHSRSSWFETSVSGPGTLTFWWSVSSEERWDALEFHVDGELESSISGTDGGWTKKTIEITHGGTHTFRWRYCKDESDSCGLDCGWVDEIVWTPVGDLFVDGSAGSDANDGHSWATAKASIQSAIDIASAGSVIVVNSGSYAPISTSNKAITICAVNGPDVTFIDGSLEWSQGVTNRCATLGETSEETATVLSSFCLMNGIADFGGGSRGGTLENCRLADNTAKYGGGSANGTLTDCVLSRNTAINGGGAYLGTLADCTISGNTASNEGGGAFFGILTDCSLTDNMANLGGGFYGNAFSGSLTNCLFSGNTANDGGGSYGGTLMKCTLRENSASNQGGGSFGGTLTKCTISGNTANDSGGGAYNGALMSCTISGNSAKNGGGASQATLDNCTVSGNEATKYGGGVYGNSYGGIANGCKITRNTAEDGGGSYGATLNSCILSSNTAKNGGGARDGTLNNCTVVNNSASGSGGGSYGTALNNCIVWDNSAPLYSAHCGARCQYSCLDEALSAADDGGGNIFTDPLFVDALRENFRLREGSPCDNAGTNEYVMTESDFYGATRIVDERVDMGASERQWVYSTWAAKNHLGAADDVTAGQYNLFRYVFNMPTNACNPFVGISFTAENRPVIQTLAPVNTNGVTIKVLSSTNLTDWAQAEWKLLTIQSGGELVFEDDTEDARFYRLKVEE